MKLTSGELQELVIRLEELDRWLDNKFERVNVLRHGDDWFCSGIYEEIALGNESVRGMINTLKSWYGIPPDEEEDEEEIKAVPVAPAGFITA
jgi:hypothetical protein